MPRLSPPDRCALFDEVLVLFHCACDQRDNKVAFELIAVLDGMAMREAPLPDSEVRLSKLGLVAAHERLWEMRHPPGNVEGEAILNRSAHRYGLGEHVVFQPYQEQQQIFAGIYSIERLLPSSGIGEIPVYEIKSVKYGHERIVT